MKDRAPSLLFWVRQKAKSSKDGPPAHAKKTVHFNLSSWIVAHVASHQERQERCVRPSRAEYILERSCAGSLQEQKSLVIEKRGTPQAVLMSIRDYVRLAARSRKCSLGEELGPQGLAALRITNGATDEFPIPDDSGVRAPGASVADRKTALLNAGRVHTAVVP